MICKFPGIDKVTNIIDCQEEQLIKAVSQLQNPSFFIDKGFYRKWQKHPLFKNKNPVFLLPAGEACKQWKILGEALAFLLKNNHDRYSPIVVIGGGAACDLGALSAALYQRGTPLVLIPTTMLAMLDAAIGGKTAIDAKQGKTMIKNFAGTFYPAGQVLLWRGWLKTLPLRERRSAIGELCKMLWLTGYQIPLADMKQWLQAGAVSQDLWWAVRHASLAKAKIVEQDPYDKKGIRAVLNYGHTFGHAIEAYTRGKLSHGEAVMLGMLLESRLVSKTKKFPQTIKTIADDLGFRFPKKLQNISPKKLHKYLLADKKRKSTKLTMSVLASPNRLISVTYNLI